MRILDRYFLREFGRPLFYCLGAFLMCWFVYDLLDNFNEFLESKNFLGAIQYYIIILPAWIVQIMPITLLLALLYTLADMSKAGELIAMRATGLDLYRSMIPIFIIAGLVTLVMTALNVFWAPRAQMMAKDLQENLGKKDSERGAKGIGYDVFYKSLQSSRAWYVEVLDFDKKTARNIDLVQSTTDGTDIAKYVAERGSFANGYWTLHDVLVYDLQKEAKDQGSARIVPTLELKEFNEDPDRFETKQKKPKRMTTGELMLSLQMEKHMPRQRKAQYLTELYNRFAFPFSNLVVILIGIPFGITPNRRSTFMAITNALLIFFVYQIVYQLFLVLGSNGQFPALFAVWLPNLAFAGLGVWLIRSIR